MEYISINPKTVINISPQKYGWKHLENEETLKLLPKTTIYINHSAEIEALAKMITSVTNQYCVISTTDNAAFIKRFYALVKDNLILKDIPEELSIEDIRTLQVDNDTSYPDSPLKYVHFSCYYSDLELMLEFQLKAAGLWSDVRKHLSKEELETPLVIDESMLSLHPVIDGKVYYLSPIALRYITYIYASIIHQFIFGK